MAHNKSVEKEKLTRPRLPAEKTGRDPMIPCGAPHCSRYYKRRAAGTGGYISACVKCGDKIDLVEYYVKVVDDCSSYPTDFREYGWFGHAW